VKRLVLSAVVCAGLVFFSHDCHAQATGSLDLLNNAKGHDGKAVAYKGEVIGDIMVRGDHAWLHVNDGHIAIGVWAPKELIRDISYVGDYQRKGDIVEVSGTFHRSCPEHGGDLDIHASAIKKIASGTPVIQPLSRKKAYIGIFSLLFVLLLLPKLLSSGRFRPPKFIAL